MSVDSRMSSASGIYTPFQALRRAPLFEGLSEDELAGVIEQVRPRLFGAQEELCRAGEQGDRMWLIVNGLVHALAPAEGPEAPIVAKQRRGDVVGAMGVATGEPHSATVVATIPTDTLELQRDAFEQIVDRHPLVMANLMRILSRRLATATARAHAQLAERGEAVALFVGESAGPSVDDIAASTRAASPGEVEVLDARRSLDRALSALDGALDEHRTVLLVADIGHEQLPNLLDHVDRAVAIVADDEEARTIAGLASQPALERHPVEVVAVAEAPESRPRGLTRVQGAIPVTRLVSPGPDATGPLPPHDLAWLGRHLARTKLGLALGAGGARGYAHVGALQVLEENGYTVDYVAGSSIGAIVGSLVSFGARADEIDAILRDAFDAESIAETFKLAFSGQSTGLDTIKRIMRDLAGGRTFEDTAIPLTIMAVDLAGKRPAPIREGPIWEALMAATALAGMFPPWESAGQRLVDGLALVPVPTGSVIEDGADVTVSVNLMSRELLPAWPGEEPPPPPAPRRGSRMLETIMEVLDLAQLDNSVRHAALADVVCTPRFGPNSWRDFHLADQFLAAGREEAERQLPLLKSLARAQFAGSVN